jgi:hypothetical protein
VADRRFVAFQGATRRALATPAEAFEESPDVARMIPHAARLFDQFSDPPCGPQLRVEPESFGTALQPAFDLTQLCRGQLRLASRPSRKFQARATVHQELPCPAIDRLPMHADLARNLRLAQSLSQQRCRLHAPRFQRSKIPPHPRRIPHADRLARFPGRITILGDSQ